MEPRRTSRTIIADFWPVRVASVERGQLFAICSVVPPRTQSKREGHDIQSCRKTQPNIFALQRLGGRLCLGARELPQRLKPHVVLDSNRHEWKLVPFPGFPNQFCWRQETAKDTDLGGCGKIAVHACLENGAVWCRKSLFKRPKLNPAKSDAALASSVSLLGGKLRTRPRAVLAKGPQLCFG